MCACSPVLIMVVIILFDGETMYVNWSCAYLFVRIT